MSQEPSPYDSHPSSKGRLAWARAMALPDQHRPDDDDEVWALFESREAMEQQMTPVARDNVAMSHDIAIGEERVV